MSERETTKTIDTHLAGFSPTRRPAGATQRAMTRECWLTLLVERLRAHLAGHGDDDRAIDRAAATFLLAWGSPTIIPLVAAFLESRVAEMPGDVLEALDSAIGQQIHRRARRSADAG